MAISVRQNHDRLASIRARRIISKNSRVSSGLSDCVLKADPFPHGMSLSAHTRDTFSFCPRRATSANSRKFVRWAVNEIKVRMRFAAGDRDMSPYLTCFCSVLPRPQQVFELLQYIQQALEVELFSGIRFLITMPASVVTTFGDMPLHQ